MSKVKLVVKPWKGFKRDGSTENHWVMQGSWTGKQEFTIKTRKFLHKIPYFGVRLMTHEIEHMLKDFNSNSKHHDSQAWADEHGTIPHNCGRGFGWKGYFTYRHLQTPKAWAKELIKTGELEIIELPYQKI